LSFAYPFNIQDVHIPWIPLIFQPISKPSLFLGYCSTPNDIQGVFQTRSLLYTITILEISLSGNVLDNRTNPINIQGVDMIIYLAWIVQNIQAISIIKYPKKIQTISNKGALTT
jgi:hypothetical protein